MTTLLPLELGLEGKILVEYRCDGCGRTTVQHPDMRLRPMKPYSTTSAMRHACESCQKAPVGRRATAQAQLSIGTELA